MASQPGWADPNAGGYPPPGQPGYPPQGQQGYPPPSQYPPPGQPGYPPPGQPGYPPPGQPGYPPPGQPGYPPAGPPGYAPQGQYPPPSGQPGYPDPSGAPVTAQPGAYQPPPPMAQQAAPVQYEAVNVPPGLEYLTQVDQLLVKQKVELLEAFLGCETKNKYKIKNSMGQEIYSAKEDTDCCTRNLCGPIRPFDIKIKDNSDNEVIHLNRPLACQSCLFPCCMQSIEISSPPGTIIGTVEQEWSMCEPQFLVKDQDGNVALRIEGPFCTFSICGDVEFKVLSPDGSAEVGKISKQWTGLLKEAFTDADNFGISFPMDLDVRMKATLLGALFLIDFMFFEKKGNEESDGLGMM